MASAAGIILIAGGLTLTNEILAAPAPVGDASSPIAINWRVIPATAVGAILFSGIEQINKQLAIGLAVAVLLTTVIVPMGNNVSPIVTIAKTMGYGSPCDMLTGRLREACYNYNGH